MDALGGLDIFHAGFGVFCIFQSFMCSLMLVIWKRTSFYLLFFVFLIPQLHPEMRKLHHLCHDELFGDTIWNVHVLPEAG